MVQVKISDGLLEGEIRKNEYGGSFYSFKGIPYAKPPLGELRFKAPQPVEPWGGVRDATKGGAICSQFENVLFHQYMGQEDCLYLNISSPDLKPNRLLPVMVWIHGGGFFSGSGEHDMYGPEFLVKNDIILVTFNYRLEALGFLCLDTEDIPGNAGMKDQVAVLRWVQKNIQHFGGDPKNVTIFGQSAGGASVSFHLISPMSAGLFKRAIVQSGTFTNWWAKCRKPRERALVLARRLGCYSEDDEEITKFLKSVPVESLVKLRLPLTISEGHKTKIDLPFSIVNEKRFNNSERFYFENEHENTRLTIHENVEIVVGYNEHEGIIGMNPFFNIDNALQQANDFADYFVPNSIIYKIPVIEQIDIGNKIKKFYFGNEKISKKNIKQLLNFLSTDVFIYGSITFAKMAAQNTNKVYLYKFTCKTKRNIFTEKYGVQQLLGEEVFVSHSDEIPYIFPVAGATEKVDEDSVEYSKIQRMTKLWTNFAKYGNPTPDDSYGIRWSPFTIDQQDYLNIGNELTLHKRPEEAEIEFWDSIYNEFSGLIN